MIGTVILAVLGAWILLSIITTVACAALVRGGASEDRARGYTSDLSPARVPSPSARQY